MCFKDCTESSVPISPLEEKIDIFSSAEEEEEEEESKDKEMFGKKSYTTQYFVVSCEFVSDPYKYFAI